MCRAYLSILEAPSKTVNGETFNIGFENKKVIEIAELVKKNVGDKVSIIKKESNDNRSYHISSKKIKNLLKFSPKYTIKNAIEDLKDAFEKKLLPNSLEDEKYFNIKKMQKIQLK